MSSAILELDQVNKRFGPAVTADRLSLAVERGEFFTLLGPSGSGKSTVLRMIAGLERPDSGRIVIEGEDMTGVPPWRRNLGMVFQNYAVFPHMSVTGNVGYGLRVRRTPAADASERVAAMLRMVGLEGMGTKNVTLLSGGEQQRVALARALILRPALLLLDEPLSALDEKIRREMQTELKRIHRETGTTFVYVTHDQEEALTMSDRIAILNRGTCVQCDAPERLYRRPKTRFVARFFRGCNVLDADLIGTADGRARVGLAGTVLSVPWDGAPRSGRVGLALRAEDVKLGSAAEMCEARLTGRLGEMIYRGTNVDHLIDLGDGQKLVATATSRAAPAAPSEIAVGIDASSIALLDD
jgi:ABC-type Fe3+/spermidine/putrescine transport system ATPase subunit